jgi:hypothetical protein
MYLPNIQAILQKDLPLRKKELAKLLLQNAIQGVLLNIMMVMGLVLRTLRELICAIVTMLLVE